VGATPDIEKVGRIASVEFDHVHGGHRQSSTVHHAADLATQVYEAEPFALGVLLFLLLLGWLVQSSNPGMTVTRIVVEGHLGVDCHDFPFFAAYQWVNFCK